MKKIYTEAKKLPQMSISLSFKINALYHVCSNPVGSPFY